MRHIKKNNPRRKYRKRIQRGGILNRYNFAYACRGILNQAGKIAPGIIKNATNEINDMAQQRINQILIISGKKRSGKSAPQNS